MRIPRYVQLIMLRARFGGYEDPRCNPGYTLVIRKESPYTQISTFRAEMEKLTAWANRQEGCFAEILDIPQVTHHCTQVALVTITDPAMKYLEPYINRTAEVDAPVHRS